MASGRLKGSIKARLIQFPALATLFLCAAREERKRRNIGEVTCFNGETHWEDRRASAAGQRPRSIRK